MKIAVYPGSFDPVTLGHMDVIERAAALFDRVYVCAMANGGKNPMFTAEQRFELLRAAVGKLDNVTAESWTGLLADYAREKGARWLVKGVRSATDFDAEYGMAQINRGLDAQLDTVLIPARPELLHVSSTMAREMIKYRQPLALCMPEAAIRVMKGWDTDGKS
ncbi:MAG: pantetheine-phosphate adenylyltransferase [Ruminococcaceae bacterium]|jgi:pantetheine-phosphate adenylyltransferase|nr:pantetheine-phosphate adenylyltransferase [Oscillospiraceae bacterium]